MNIDEYMLLTLKNNMLLKDSVIDIATIMGHTPTHPISSHIFCLEFNFTREDHDKILLKLNLLSDKKTLNLAEIRSEITKIVPEVSELPEAIFKGMLSIFLKQFDIPLTVPELN